MAIRWAQETLPRYAAVSIWQAMGEAREQGKSETDYLPEAGVVGGAILIDLRRKSCCRACGQDMKKGASAIQFAYRWVPGFHYRITESFMHPERCN